MRVLVTGGAGRVGAGVVSRLLKRGHQVRVVDRCEEVSEGDPRVDWRRCDVTDFDGLREHVRGMEALVHLAGIPHPIGAPGHELFRVNCAGTCNVYEAAAQEGIRRVVSASSLCALGYAWGSKSSEPDCFPIDEEQPLFTTDPYGFSKQVLEEIAAYYWRREGISGVCLRLPLVLDFARPIVVDGKEFHAVDQIAGYRASLDSLLGLDEGERRERLAWIISEHEALRGEKVFEFGRVPDPSVYEGVYTEEDVDLMLGRSLFWACIDARDSARAFERALLAEYEGSHALYVSDTDSLAGVESRVLVELCFPGAAVRSDLGGTGSLVSSERARALIGFEVEHSVNAQAT